MYILATHATVAAEFLNSWASLYQTRHLLKILEYTVVVATAELSLRAIPRGAIMFIRTISTVIVIVALPSPRDTAGVIAFEVCRGTRLLSCNGEQYTACNINQQAGDTIAGTCMLFIHKIAIEVLPSVSLLIVTTV